MGVDSYDSSMKKLFLASLLLGLSHSAFSSDFCLKNSEDIRLHLSETKSRIAFKNKGGLINGGVCWWHSRLQRSSAYLIKFRPEIRQKPSLEEVRKILRHLRDMDKVVIINGYSNFRDFSYDFRSETQKMLEGWQKIDGFLNHEWIRGISGKSSLPPNELKAQMEKIYTAYKSSPTPIWVMLQIKGITAHAALVTSMTESNKGFNLTVIDSNNPSDESEIYYSFGDTSLRIEGEGYSFIPYLGFQRDFTKMFSAINEHCNRDGFAPKYFDIQDGDIER